ncbi:hypothetical protein GCM10027059_01820 [Myceligenerans halotolerans]
MTTPSPLERGAKAAYTRPDGSIPWERRKPRTRAYWRSVAARALAAALDRGQLAEILRRHARWNLPDEVHCQADWQARCICGAHIATTRSAHAADLALYAHQAAAIRDHILTPVPVVRIVPDDDPGRMYGQGYDGGWDDEGTAAEAARVARELENRRQHETDDQADDEGEDQS